MVISTNPRTGQQTETSLTNTPDEGVRSIVEDARRASPHLASMGRERRADLLDAFADAIEERRADLVRTTDAETGLGDARLSGELSRSAFQMRLFGEAVREGSYVEATIDHAGPTPLGPGPDLRRMLVPIGPVAVFGASNFPYAFSVLGGDTASAIAAGCPVVVKGHDSHPLTSQLSIDLLRETCVAHGVPDTAVSLVLGLSAGAVLVADPGIQAVGFTGSLSGGRALLEIVNRREVPVPFFGELSSLNPLVVTRLAARARAEDIATGLVGSVTGSGGQLCTKPGIVFVPEGPDGDKLVETLASLLTSSASHVLLNRRIHDSFVEFSERLALEPGVTTVSSGSGREQQRGFAVPARLLTISAQQLRRDLVTECFGPLVLVVGYTDFADLQQGLSLIPGSLTASIHAEESETDLVADLVADLASVVGRLVFNGYPTGVRVSWAQHHGGPWPATNSQHTSVGVSAIRRFLRPLAWQDAAQGLLPHELKDETTTLPRRVDGVLVPARASGATASAAGLAPDA